MRGAQRKFLRWVIDCRVRGVEEDGIEDRREITVERQTEQRGSFT